MTLGCLEAESTPGRAAGRIAGRAALPFALMCSAFAVGQPSSTAPPPGGLPRLISECESGPNYAACSVWVWHGSSYSAVWQNGAVGRLTVADAASGHASFTREDTAGPVAGLTATYTAKWDGSTFEDGKIVATLKGGTNTLAWTGTATVTPVLPTPQRDFSYTNWYSGPLTGFARFGGQGSFTKATETEIDDFRLRNEPPMSPGESRLFTLRYFMVPPNYEKGVRYPDFSAIAAIYADGTTFGDANVLAVMFERRKAMLAALNAIGPTLCSMGGSGAPIGDIAAALERQQAAGKARTAAATDGASLAYAYVQKSLGSRVNNHLPPNQAIKRTWEDFNKLRSGLFADPVRDPGGNPLIPTAPPLECNLP